MTVRIVVDVIVRNEELLHYYAIGRMEECWGTAFAEETPDIPRQVYEALIASNENPSPDQYGIELGDSEVYFV